MLKHFKCIEKIKCYWKARKIRENKYLLIKNINKNKNADFLHSLKWGNKGEYNFKKIMLKCRNNKESTMITCHNH
jgi:hypothetical protein